MKQEIHPKTLALEEFSARLRKFCEKHNLSNRQLANLLGNRQFASKTSCWRLMNGTIKEKYYFQFLAPLEIAFETFLEKGGFSSEQIERELTNLFPYRSDREMITTRCKLGADAISFFGLKADPFDIDKVLSSDETFSNREFDNVTARVKDAIIGNQMISVIGPVGSGKTVLKSRIVREAQNGQYKTRFLFPEFFEMADVKVGAIARYILEEFEIKCPSDSVARVRKIKQLLTSLRNEDTRIALVFDECHKLNDKVILSLKNFWEMTNDAYDRLLSILLFGQPKFIDTTLRDTKFQEIAERMEVIQMPKIENSARDYLAHKIAVAGGNIEELFDKRAVEKIIRVAKTPLALGNIANESLMEAFKLGETRVVAEMLKLPEMPKIQNFRRAA